MAAWVHRGAALARAGAAERPRDLNLRRRGRLAGRRGPIPSNPLATIACSRDRHRDARDALGVERESCQRSSPPPTPESPLTRSPAASRRTVAVVKRRRARSRRRPADSAPRGRRDSRGGCRDHGGRHVLVAQEFLHRPDVIAVVQEVGSKRVPKSMTTCGLHEACGTHGFLHRALQYRGVDVMAPLDPGARIDGGCVAGNTYCHRFSGRETGRLRPQCEAQDVLSHPHSRFAFGYFFSNAKGRYTAPNPPRGPSCGAQRPSPRASSTARQADPGAW
jgi:hypothetical protein